jgi:hypothetical protein
LPPRFAHLHAAVEPIGDAVVAAAAECSYYALLHCSGVGHLVGGGHPAFGPRRKLPLCSTASALMCCFARPEDRSGCTQPVVALFDIVAGWLTPAFPEAACGAMNSHARIIFLQMTRIFMFRKFLSRDAGSGVRLLLRPSAYCFRNHAIASTTV